VRHFVGFVLALNEAVKGRKLSDCVHESQAVQALLKVRLCIASAREPPNEHQEVRYIGVAGSWVHEYSPPHARCMRSTKPAWWPAWSSVSAHEKSQADRVNLLSSGAEHAEAVGG